MKIHFARRRKDKENNLNNKYNKQKKLFPHWITQTSRIRKMFTISLLYLIYKTMITTKTHTKCFDNILHKYYHQKGAKESSDILIL